MHIQYQPDSPDQFFDCLLPGRVQINQNVFKLSSGIPENVLCKSIVQFSSTSPESMSCQGRFHPQECQKKHYKDSLVQYFKRRPPDSSESMRFPHRPGRSRLIAWIGINHGGSLFFLLKWGGLLLWGSPTILITSHEAINWLAKHRPPQTHSIEESYYIVHRDSCLFCCCCLPFPLSILWTLRMNCYSLLKHPANFDYDWQDEMTGWRKTRKNPEKEKNWSSRWQKLWLNMITHWFWKVLLRHVFLGLAIFC